MNKFAICKQTRKFAADSLYEVLKKMLSSSTPISEVTLRDAWLAEVMTNKNIFPNGWYMPPPHGMIILFGDDNHIQRFDYKNARTEETWAKNDVFLNKENGVIFCYASPVDKETGIIGDFGITLYLGQNADMKNLLKTCLKIDKDTFEYATIGMKINDVATYVKKQIDKYGMSNQIVSLADKAVENVGHSIPAVYEEWTHEERQIILNGEKDWTAVKDMISKKRFFVNASEQLVIKPSMAFTIEPRPKMLNKPNLPASLNYHTIALFKDNGEKELLTNFDELFKLAGMEYML